MNIARDIAIKSQTEIREENRLRLNREMANASKFGRTAQVQKLLQLGADVNFVSPSNFGYTALHHAAREGHTDSVNILLKYGANTEVRDKVEHRTPLHCATARNKTECMDMLITEGGAFIDARDKNNNTALHIAVSVGNVNDVMLLVNRGADKNLKNYKDQTAFVLAAQKRNEDCADILLRGTHFKDARSYQNSRR
ncbi:ankyrin repeat and SOCS box protein 8-like [Mytilus californianus]|uniref:ankyrin repeat and SOCS box protein 8-like n=1 Tax=Mytilus californianus TaxID=6549 RepID=UPI0022452BD7|nr:ankyrin repeat and SOCS box protein 8-like [Mytilus californianus]